MKKQYFAIIILAVTAWISCATAQQNRSNENQSPTEQQIMQDDEAEDALNSVGKKGQEIIGTSASGEQQTTVIDPSGKLKAIEPAPSAANIPPPITNQQVQIPKKVSPPGLTKQAPMMPTKPRPMPPANKGP